MRMYKPNLSKQFKISNSAYVGNLLSNEWHGMTAS